MGSTTNYAWPLPDESSSNDYPGHMAALGDAIDATVATLVQATVKAATPPTSFTASLSGLAQSFDGVAINSDGDRVLLTNQPTASQNGIWVAHSGAWTRPKDYAHAAVLTGAIVSVAAGGGVLGGSVFHCTNAGSFTVDTTATTWTSNLTPTETVSGQSVIVAGAITIPDVTVATLHRVKFGTANAVFTFPPSGAGKSFSILLQQDSVGSRTATWPVAVDWGGAGAPVLSTSPNSVDLLSFVCFDGTNWIGSAAKGFTHG